MKELMKAPKKGRTKGAQNRPPGTGSIYQRKDGRWVASITLGYEVDPRTGRKKRVYQDKYFHSEPEAGRWLARALLELEQGSFIPPDRITVGEYLTDWLENVVRPMKEPGTYAGYASTLHKHVIPEIGTIPLQKLNSQQVQALWARLYTLGVSKKRVSNVRETLGTAYRHAVKLGLVARDVVAPTTVAKHRTPEMQVFTKEEVARLLAAASTHRLYAAFVLALMLGMRVGEYLGLHWADVNLSAGTVRVRGTVQQVSGQGLVYKRAKSASSERTLHLPQRCIEALSARREIQMQERERAGANWEEHGYIFTSRTTGRGIPSTTFREIHARLCKKADVSNLTVHVMRHTAITHQILSGIPIPIVSKLAGHASPVITMRVYSHVVESMNASIADRLDELWG